MEPLSLLAWVGSIALCIIITAITVLIIWSVTRTIRGKTVVMPTRTGPTMPNFR